MGIPKSSNSERSFRLKSWQLFIIFISLLFLLASGLRFDHRKMERLIIQVKNADQNNNQEELTQRLKELRNFVASHTVISINEENGRTIFILGTGPIYLESQYLKIANQELEKANKYLSSSGAAQKNVYAEASKVCQPLAIKHGWAWNSKGYIDCMMGELAKHPASPEINDLFQAILPSTELYRINYASPLWAPTPVGWLMVLSLIVALILIFRIIYWLILQITLITMRKR